jgi:MFS family permease
MDMSSLSISILKLPNFRLLLITRILTTFALQAQAVIVGWQIYSLTKDPFLLGLTGLVEAVPALTCALFAGHIVDNHSPYRIFRLCLGFLTLNTLFLLLVGGGTIRMDTDRLLIFIFIGVFFSGLARSFYMPASFSLLPVIVPRKDIPAAASWLTSGFQIATIAGPAIAGLIYGGYGPHGAWFMPFIILTMALIMISLMNPPFYQA